MSTSASNSWISSSFPPSSPPPQPALLVPIVPSMPPPQTVSEPCGICDSVFTFHWTDRAGMSDQMAAASAREQVEQQVDIHRREVHGLWRQKDLREVISREIETSGGDLCQDLNIRSSVAMEIAFRIRNGHWQKIPPLEPR